MPVTFPVGTEPAGLRIRLVDLRLQSGLQRGRSIPHRVIRPNSAIATSRPATTRQDIPSDGGDWILEYATGKRHYKSPFFSESANKAGSVFSVPPKPAPIIDVKYVHDRCPGNQYHGRTSGRHQRLPGNSVVVWQGKKQDVPGSR